MSFYAVLIAAGCAASAAAGQDNATALALAKSGPTPAPLAGPLVYLGSGASSPCGGDIVLPAATNSLVTVFTCADRLDYNLQLTLTSNPSASAWGIYIAWGDACGSPTPPPGSFFPEVSTVATAANPNPFLTGFCLTNLCCGAYSCRSPPCGAGTIAVDYTPPSAAVCSVNNQQITGFQLSTSRVLGLDCINVANNYELSFTLSNPFPERVSVFMASGTSNCGVFYNFDTLLPANGGIMPPGFTPAASAIATNANSFQFTSRCTDEPCCAIVWCHSTNIGFCMSMRYSLTFDRVPTNTALAAGIIAGIAVGTLVCLCAVAFLIWRARTKYSQPQTTTVMVMNPGAPTVNAWGQTAQAYPPPPPSFVVPPPPPKV